MLEPSEMHRWETSVVGREEREFMIIILDSSDQEEAEIEGYDEILKKLNMFEEAIYHSEPFTGIFGDSIGGVYILRELFFSNLEGNDCEEYRQIFIA